MDSSVDEWINLAHTDVLSIFFIKHGTSQRPGQCLLAASHTTSQHDQNRTEMYTSSFYPFVALKSVFHFNFKKISTIGSSARSSCTLPLMNIYHPRLHKIE